MVDIKKELTENKDNLSLADLDYFINQLEIGDFDDDYYADCLVLITQIRDELLYKRTNFSSTSDTPVPFSGGVLVKPGDIDPSHKGKTTSMDEQLIGYIIASRTRSTNKQEFVKLVQTKKITEPFFEKYFAQLTSVEFDWAMENYFFSEQFIEKHIDNLSKVVMSATQKFSEDFFMKYMNKFDVKVVMTKSPNPWTTKNARSKKLDTILKLKGYYL